MGWATKLSEERIPLKVSTPPVTDTWNLAYLVFFALGAAVLLPWNAFISAVDYFDYLYPASDITRVFSVAYLVPCLVFLCFLTIYGQHYKSSHRINGGLGFYLFAVVLMPVMDALLVSKEGANRFTHYASIMAVACTGVADALVQGSIIGAAGELPERYMQAFVAGTAACGVLVSLLRVITKASYSSTAEGLRSSANLYFMVSGAFLALCIVAYNLSLNLPIMIHYRDLKNDSIAEEKSVLEEAVAVKYDSGSRLTSTSNYGAIKYVLVQIQWLAFAIVGLYVVTMSIFPGFLAEDVHSVALGDWYPVLLIGAYNVFDLIGKCSTAVYILDSKFSIVSGSFARIVFFPLYYVCLHGPPFFRTETPVFALTSLLGLTNGYFSSCLLIVAPKAVPYAAAETAGIVMTLALVIGLTLGATLGFVWVI